MRIGFNFHTANNCISGVEYYSLGLLRSLLKIDNENQCVVFTNKPSLVQSAVGNEDNLFIRDCGFLKSRSHRILWEHLKLPGLAKREKLDILHCPHYICPVIKTSVPYVVTIHDTIAIDHPRWCKTTNAAYYNMFMRRAVKTATNTIAVSQFTSERIRYNFNVNGSKVKVIYPGIDGIFNLYHDAEEERRVQAKYKLPDKYVLYSGNIEPKKNIFNLLRAFKLLKNKELQHALVITGNRTWKSKRVWNYIRSEFKTGDIKLAGYIDRSELGFVYKSAGCLISTSYYEGFGFPVLEAFACGLPVAASYTGVLKELDTQAYTLIDPDSPAEIAESVIRLITNHKLREQQINAALVEVAKYNWTDCATRTVALYREAIESNG